MDFITERREGMKKATIVVILVLMAVATLTVPFSAAAFAATDASSGGDQVVSGFKTFASGSWGKAIFACCLLIAIGCLIFTKHRMFGLIALAVGVALGMYGGILDQLWSLFTSWGGGTT
jgi:hypothetical protein